MDISDIPDEKNMLHEFVKGAFDDASGVADVVESILGALGHLRRDAYIIDATVETREESVLHEVAARHHVGVVDARGVSTGVNECIERTGVDPRDIACVVAFNPPTHLVPVVVLTPAGGHVSGYAKAYSDDAHVVFVRRDLARRAGLTSLQIMLG